MIHSEKAWLSGNSISQGLDIHELIMRLEPLIGSSLELYSFNI